MAEGSRPEAFAKKRGASKVKIGPSNIAALRSVVNAFGGKSDASKTV